jgi:hypothetical protein
MFIGLNPSTADETKDDPTIRRCVQFAKDWGYEAVCMTNLFAFRATDPKAMLAEPDPVGQDNDRWLLECASGAEIVVAAWGANGGHMGRGDAVRGMFEGLQKLRLTKGGFPQHPLYLPASLCPTEWKRDR